MTLPAQDETFPPRPKMLGQKTCDSTRINTRKYKALCWKENNNNSTLCHLLENFCHMSHLQSFWQQAGGSPRTNINWFPVLHQTPEQKCLGASTKDKTCHHFLGNFLWGGGKVVAVGQYPVKDSSRRIVKKVLGHAPSL